MELTGLQSNSKKIEQHFPTPAQPEACDTQEVPLSQLTIDDLCVVLQADPYSSVHARQLARKYTERGNYALASKIYSGICKVDNCFESLFDLGTALYLEDRPHSALPILQQALLVSAEADDQSLFEIFKMLGNIFVKSGDYDSGEDAYIKALRIRPQSDVLVVNLGTLKVQQSDWESATDRFREAVQLNQLNDKAWVGLSICHRQKGDVELSWANLEMALECNPLNETALTLACDWAVRDKKQSRLLEMLRTYAINDGWNIDLNLTFVWLSWTLGERSSATLVLERILSTHPECEAGWRIYEKMGECA